jgi:hypothetical protein
MYNLLYASRAQKVEIDTTDSKAGNQQLAEMAERVGSELS